MKRRCKAEEEKEVNKMGKKEGERSWKKKKKINDIFVLFTLANYFVIQKEKFIEIKI